jgi:hypothetical protein
MENWRKFVEGINSETGEPDYKYYAFDWDDNLMYMPTKIFLKAEDGSEVSMTTGDFAKWRGEIDEKKHFKYGPEGKTIVGYAENPFRMFRVEGDKQFLKDIAAKTTPLATDRSWNKFVEVINGGSYFAIITARGHSPLTLENGVKELIKIGRGGLDKDKLIDSLVAYQKIVDANFEENEETIKELLLNYFNNCQFSPVSYGEASASNPEQAKVEALEEFEEKLKKINSEREFELGFSDDDPKNVEVIDKELGDRIKVIYTGPDKDDQ